MSTGTTRKREPANGARNTHRAAKKHASRARQSTRPPGGGANPAPRQPKAVDAAANSLRSAILGGVWPPGSVLPGERDLAEGIGISRLTLRAALAKLESEGLIQSVHGSGNRVLNYWQTGGIELMGHLMAAAFEGGRVPDKLVADLLELRRFIAIEILALSCARATPEQFRQLETVVQEMNQVSDTTDFIARDLAFARLLVRSADNMALEFLFNTVVRMIESTPALQNAFIADPERTTQVYRRILTLLKARDAARIRVVARKLLEWLDRATLQFLFGHRFEVPMQNDLVSMADVKDTAASHGEG